MDKITILICKIFKIPKENFDENLKKDDIESWDSLSHMELITTLEEEFDIEFTMDEIVEMVSVKKIKEIVYKKLGYNGD